MRFDPIWSSWYKINQVWSSLVQLDQIWSSFIKLDQVWLITIKIPSEIPDWLSDAQSNMLTLNTASPTVKIDIERMTKKTKYLNRALI